MKNEKYCSCSSCKDKCVSVRGDSPTDFSFGSVLKNFLVGVAVIAFLVFAGELYDKGSNFLLYGILGFLGISFVCCIAIILGMVIRLLWGTLFNSIKVKN